MQVRFKKLVKEAVLPSYSRLGDAGLDLVATSKTEESTYIEYGTGLAVEIPKGFVGWIFPRSSISKYNLMLCNAVPVIDSNFRGEIRLRFKKVLHRGVFNNNWTLWEENNTLYKIGDRIGQLIIMPYPVIEVIEADELSETERGEKGFGSSGR